MLSKERFRGAICRTAISLAILGMLASPSSAKAETPPPTPVVTQTPELAGVEVPDFDWTEVTAPIQAADLHISNGNDVTEKNFMLPFLDREILGDDFQDFAKIVEAQVCGAFLIGSKYVAFESHCGYRIVIKFPDDSIEFIQMPAKDMCFGFGSNNLIELAQTGKILCATSVRFFEINENEHYGLAIAELPEELRTGVSYAHLPLPTDTRVVGEQVAIYGWGITEEAPSPTQLQEGILTINSDSVCDQYIDRREPKASYFHAGDGFPIANDGTPKVDSEHGDSGGPLMKWVTWNQVVSGMTAYGEQRIPDVWNNKVGDPYYACGVYTDISQFIDEIKSVVGADELQKVYAQGDQRLFDGRMVGETFFGKSVLSNDQRAWMVSLQSPLFEVDDKGNLVVTSKASYQSFQDGTLRLVTNSTLNKGTNLYAFLTVTSRSGAQVTVAPLVFTAQHSVYLPMLAK